MAEDRERRPPDVARQLRKNAGFGCCACGLPIYEYHHIVPYSEEEHYRVEDMMILCPLCHDAATKGAMTVEEQRKFQARPHNIEKGYVFGNLKINQTYCALRSGGVLLVGDLPLISIDNNPLISIKNGNDGIMLLSINPKGKDGRDLAIIDDNEWISGDLGSLDIESDHQKLILREKKGRVSLSINAKGDPVEVFGWFYHNGEAVRLSNSGLRVTGSGTIRPNIANLGLVGISVNFNTRNQTIDLVPYVGLGAFVNYPDPAYQLQKAVEAWEDILNKRK